MRKDKGQLRISASAPLPAIKRTDTSSDPGKTYNWGHMSAVQRGWLLLFGRPHEGSPDLTFKEIRSIEARVRKELYP